MINYTKITFTLMKNILIILVINSFLISCNKTPEKRENIDVTKTQINNVLNNWHKNAAEANFDAYFNALTPTSVFIGTDASENWNIEQFKNFSKPYFDRGNAWDFKAIDRNIYLDAEGKIAWFDELLNTWMGVCRGSGILKKENNEWKIEHYVLSLTIPNDNIQDIVAINREKDSIFQKNYLKN